MVKPLVIYQDETGKLWTFQSFNGKYCVAYFKIYPKYGIKINYFNKINW